MDIMEDELHHMNDSGQSLLSLKSIAQDTQLMSKVTSDTDGRKLHNGEVITSHDLIPQELEECTAGIPEDQLEATERLLRAHSSCGGPWQLCRSPLGGRGLVAARDLRAGELVLRDPPLLLAPRAATAYQSLCARCLRSRDGELRPCPAGCGMCVCCAAPDEVSQDPHAGECALLHSWGVRAPPEGAESEQLASLSNASAALRALALPVSGRQLVSALQAHYHPRHGREVTQLLPHLRSAPTEQQELLMRRACSAMDANAFEVSGRVRGLFPLGAMMNHACSPNTAHGYDAGRAMVVRAAADVPRGAELTTAYTPLLWGTPARRRHLQLTKHFLCRCPRCADPQELGSLLSGLRCGRPGCGGVVLSLQPLEPDSAWRCGTCGWQLSAAQARSLQAALGSLLAAVDTSRPDAIAAYLHSPAISRVLLPTNQVAVELKSCLLWHYGHTPGYTWMELSAEQLRWKEDACRDLLALLSQLRTGRSRLRGLLLLELSYTLEETIRRGSTADVTLQLQEVSSVQEAASIFEGDSTAPAGLWRRLEEIQSKPTAGRENLANVTAEGAEPPNGGLHS